MTLRVQGFILENLDACGNGSYNQSVMGHCLFLSLHICLVVFFFFQNEGPSVLVIVIPVAVVV